MPTVGGELPRYTCHKEVHALKIGAVVRETMPAFQRPTCRGSFAFGSACGHCERCTWEQAHGPRLGATIIPADTSYAPFDVDGAYFSKHQPEAGGYYVVYADGYKSFSPAEAFEAGYTRVEDTAF